MNIFKKNEIDMLNGSIADKLILFAIPLALTSSLQQLFNAADIAVCGRFVGSLALAAVGANAQIVNLFVNSFLGLTLGANVLIANYIGGQKNEKVKNVVQTSITFAVIFGFILLIIGLIFSKKILYMLNTPEDVLAPASLYLKIYFIGIPFFVVYNFGAAILRSIGDTKRPLIILAITGVINVILNIFFVVAFKLGVAGVAIATSIANAISATVVIILLMKETSIVKYDITKWFINFDALGKVMKIGIPAAIQGMVFSLSNLCIQSAINSLGPNTIAANTASLSFEYLQLYAFVSFTQACMTFMSQNFGAMKYDRCKRVFRDSLILGCLATGIITIIIQIFRHQLMYIYTTEAEVINIAMERFRYVGVYVVLQAVFDIESGALRALKHPVLPAVMVILGTVGFRIAWCLIVFPIYRTYKSVAVVYPLSWMVMNVAMTISYVIISRKELRG